MKVKGLVKNAATKAPVARAKVVLTVGDRELAVLFSDEEGCFEYMEEKEYVGQTLKCGVKKEGFEPQEATYKIDQDEVSPEIELVPEKPVEEKKWPPPPSPPPPPPKKWLKPAAIVGAVIVVFAIAFTFWPRTPEIISFKVEPQRIERGEKAKLSWRTRNAKSVQIAWNGKMILTIGGGDSVMEGYQKFSSRETGFYGLTAKWGWKETHKRVKVTVAD